MQQPGPRPLKESTLIRVITRVIISAKYKHVGLYSSEIFGVIIEDPKESSERENLLITN
jgi:hypothetical protein